MSDLSDALLEVVRPELEELVERLVEERLARFSPPAPEPWMTTEQAAAYLALTPQALRARARRGTVPAHRDENRYVFHRKELDQALGLHC